MAVTLRYTLAVTSQKAYYDISPPISANTAVFPGDVAFRREVSFDFDKGHNLRLSAMTSTMHLGAHCDAPNHYHPDGVGIDARPLEYYFGPAQVITVELARGARVRIADLDGVSLLAPRVLFRTRSFPNPNLWNGDFVSLSPELIEHLADRDVVLVGIDTPSIDPEDDKVLETHQAVFRRDLAVLEGIVLDEVPDGLYTLVALPLRLEGADASPVRAILLRAQLSLAGLDETPELALEPHEGRTT